MIAGPGVYIGNECIQLCGDPRGDHRRRLGIWVHGQQPDAKEHGPTASVGSGRRQNQGPIYYASPDGQRGALTPSVGPLPSRTYVWKQE